MAETFEKALGLLDKRGNVKKRKDGTPVPLEQLISKSKAEIDEENAKERIGSRERAFREVLEVIDRAEKERWSFEKLRSFIVSVKETGTEASRSNHWVGVLKGNGQKLYLQEVADLAAMKKTFSALFGFKNRKAANQYIDTGDPMHGNRIF